MAYKTIKRVADFSSAAAGLVILSPLLIPVVIGLKLTGEGYVFYEQERVGYKNRKFGILKFATMLKDSPNLGTGDITLRNDPRVTPMGKWLRMTKLNELPQIINVLKGDMSLVGPRPLMPVSFAMYEASARDVVYESPPGITGIGSLVYRDEEALVSEATTAGIVPREYYLHAIYPYKGQLEQWYFTHRGLRTDTLILLGTALSLIDSRTDWAARFFPNLPKRPLNLLPEHFTAT